jgi:hypothetical protein
VEKKVKPVELPLVIGWAELVDLPNWNITRLRAKMDTGARTSALHVENIQEIAHNRVRFDVRSETRVFVSAVIQIGRVAEEVELSLVSREKMIFRMLIGRSALGHRFLVDAGRRYVVSKLKKKKRANASSTAIRKGTSA